MGIDIGSDFSGVGAFEQALLRLGIAYKTIFACDMNKYARQTFVHNYGEPKYYPENVYDREIPIEPLDIYVSSPPCQSFSLAGKRKGEDDKRGILFYNSHEFIQKNRPRYFIFENVKGLLSDDSGKTFQRWLDYLGGKSVNGNPVIFPLKESVPYHIYHQVLNAKDYGVPQNRERIFIIGIRDDQDNSFTFPRPFHLTKRLKDVLEENVDEKYFLSDKSIKQLFKNNNDIEHLSTEGIAKTLRVGGSGSTSKKHSFDIVNIGNVNPSGNGMNGNVFDDEGICPSLTTNKGEGIKIKSATNKGYEIATDEDSINLSVPNSETRRGRVGKGVAQTLDTSCNQAVMIAHVSRSEEGKMLRKIAMANGKDFTPFQAKKIDFKEADVMNCITTATTKDNLIKIGAIRGRRETNDQTLEINNNGTSNTITSVQKDNVVVNWIQGGLQKNQPQQTNGISPCLTGAMGMGGGQTPVHNYNHRIRRLTPREAFRLMDFDDSFSWPVSDSQAYKQAGNSIVVNVLCEIIKKLNL
jgi:DNA (cytosine-5)-methyltransferase 1